MNKIRKHMGYHAHMSGNDRWMVSYADFITLLFGFFLTMYALSSVNEGHYRVLADSIAAALKKQEKKIQTETFEEPGSASHTQTLQTEDLVIKRMTDSVVAAMSPWIQQNLINVTPSPVMLQIEINASALFDSGSAEIAEQALPILQGLADILREFPNALHVEGFTDNRPIQTPAFPSNWELSAARAASVVRIFNQIGIDPKRMAAVGYGEHRPVADNATEPGRSRNRRVVLVVLAGNDPRELVDIASPQPVPHAEVNNEENAEAAILEFESVEDAEDKTVSEEEPSGSVDDIPFDFDEDL